MPHFASLFHPQSALGRPELRFNFVFWFGLVVPKGGACYADSAPEPISFRKEFVFEGDL